MVTVSATGPTGLKSYYSNYGLGVVEVAAPGGDSRVPGTEPNGRCSRLCGRRRLGLQAGHLDGGAARLRRGGVGAQRFNPHVPGLARRPPKDRRSSALPSRPRVHPAGPGVVTQYCYGGTANNGFYGHGEVNAARAVTR